MASKMAPFVVGKCGSNFVPSSFTNTSPLFSLISLSNPFHSSFLLFDLSERICDNDKTEVKRKTARMEWKVGGGIGCAFNQLLKRKSYQCW
jgi:hypothetical protein